MGSRRFEITIASAENLPDIRRLGRMKVYAEVSFNGTTKKTPTDRQRNTSPRWDVPFVYTIDEANLQRAGLDVVVDLHCERTLGDKLIGRAVIPVKSLFEKGLKSPKSISYPISGTSYGRLYIRYCFHDFIPFPKPQETQDDGDIFVIRVPRNKTGGIQDFSNPSALNRLPWIPTNNLYY